METTKKEIKRPRINKEDFIRAWATVYNNGGSQSDVAEILGCTPAGVATKSKTLVEEGVKLPELNKKRKDSTDVEGLNKLIESLIGE
jgi:predicted transcriptional regulator